MTVGKKKSSDWGGLCICEPISWLLAGHIQEAAAAAAPEAGAALSLMASSPIRHLFEGK